MRGRSRTSVRSSRPSVRGNFPMRRPLHARVAVAAAVGAAAFALYYKTLLPGLDFGDTASFQVMAGSPVITPRDAYPLYFAIGRVFTLLVPGDPAYVLNLASAV